MASQAERKALNEGAFRDANEQLERSTRNMIGPGDESLVPFLCECPRRECKQVVLLTLAEYEDVRADSRYGLAAIGHDDPSIERVIAHNERFLTTEKFGEAGEVHDQTDRRR